MTTVNPVLRLKYNGDFVSGVLNMAGFAETYARNSDLNYLGTRDTLSLSLDNSIRRLIPNASLRIDDSLTYTPLPPGFIRPTAGTSPSDPGNFQNVYAQGFQASRTDNLINNATVSTSYATTSSTSLNASYSYAILRFGSGASTQGLTLFNSTTQTGGVGGSAGLSEVDTLNVRYTHTQTEFTPIESSSSNTPTTFNADSATMGWSRSHTPNLRTELGGGGILINPGIATYAANAAVIMNSLNNSATLSYARSALPNFSGIGGAVGGILIGDVFSLSAVQKIDRQWQLAESVSYTHTSGSGGIDPVTYDSYIAGGDIQYWMTSAWATSLSYSYSKFNSDLGSANTDFVRQVIMLSLRATWE
ncbi:MAG TPA: hypothetical protein VJT11_00465 [Nitrospiraceae bacterium]|nr:hypothetical protein [Nitrospiraceae bacterium]